MRMRVLVCCIVLAAAVACTAESAYAGPRLTLSTDTWELGEIYQWTNPSTTIEITNDGDAPLEITDVKASCGCTATFLSSETIKPGQKGSLKIEFASYILSGNVNKIVRLSTNDPAAKQKDITIKGTIRDDKGAVGGLDRDYVDLGVVAPYETRSVDVIITNRGNADLNIRGIELPDGWFMDSAQPTLAKPRSVIQVRFRYRPVIQKGPIDDVVTINTSGIDGGQLRLKVEGYVADCGRTADELVVTPSAFGIGVSETRQLLFSVKNDGNAAVTIEGVDSSLDIKVVEHGGPEVKPGEARTVKLDVGAGGLAAGTKGYVYIRLGLPVEVK